jgi:hypothetical protein
MCAVYFEHERCDKQANKVGCVCVCVGQADGDGCGVGVWCAVDSVGSFQMDSCKRAASLADWNIFSTPDLSASLIPFSAYFFCNL